MVDWNDYLERKRNCNIVENADIPKFRDAMLEALRCNGLKAQKTAQKAQKTAQKTWGLHDMTLTM